MALPAYSPKVGVISGAEESLSQLATDPMKAGVALPLLFGAQAVRQGADASYDENNQFQRRLAQQIQDQTAAHQGREDLNTALNIKNPGGAFLALTNPGSGYDVNDQVRNRILTRMMGNQFAESDAEIFNKTGSGYKSFVEGGLTPEQAAIQARIGMPTTDTGPLSLRVEGMRQAGANARQAASAIQASRPTSGATVGEDGVIKPTLSNVDPTQIGTAMADLAALAKNQPTTYQGTDGKWYSVPNPNATIQTPGVLKDRKSHQLLGTVLPPAASGSGNKTTSAPPAAPVAPAAPNPPADAIKPVILNAQQTAQAKAEYVRRFGAGKTGAEAAAVTAAQVGVGQTPDGRRYLTVNGKLLQPLVPVN